MSAIAVIDFETSGFSPKYGERTIEVGVVMIEGDRIVDRYQSLMNPGFQIFSFIEKYTGITNNMLAKARPNEVVMAEVRRFVANTPMVAHNASFDKQLWESEMEYLGSISSNPFVCTMRLSRVVHPGLPSYKLEALAKHHGIISSQRAHRALADAEVAAAVLRCIRRDLREVHGVTDLSHSNLMVIQGTKTAGPAFGSVPDFSKVAESMSHSPRMTNGPVSEPIPNAGALSTERVTGADVESRAMQDAMNNAWESIASNGPGMPRTKSNVVYRILNTRNGRFYIGSTVNYERRVDQHRSSLLDGTHHNYHLMKEFKYFGIDDYDFRILARFDNRHEMLAREQLLIKMYWNTLYCYNIDHLVADEPFTFGFTAYNRKTYESLDYLSLHAIKVDLGFSKAELTTLRSGSSITIGDWELRREPVIEPADWVLRHVPVIESVIDLDFSNETELLRSNPSSFQFFQNRRRDSLFSFVHGLMEPYFSAVELRRRLFPSQPDRDIKRKYLAVAVKHGFIEKCTNKDSPAMFRIANSIPTDGSIGLSSTQLSLVAALLAVMAPVFSEKELFLRCGAKTTDDFYKWQLQPALASGLVAPTLPAETPRKRQRYVCTGKPSIMLRGKRPDPTSTAG